MERVDSLQTGYAVGDLSLYPSAIDSKDSLYEVANNASNFLKQSLTYSGKKIIVETTEGFPSMGLLRITNGNSQGELIYYKSKTNNTFKDLIRGFAGSRQNQWNIGSSVSNSVCAEHHNAVKDAIIKLEENLGLKENPNEESLNGLLKNQENKFLKPKPLFRAYPTSGSAPLTVSFQNFSPGMAPNFLNGPLIRCFWDFGDGTTSTEKNPIHTYLQEGSYSVELVVASILGGQGIVTKNNYIKVDNTLKPNFFYVKNSPDKFPILINKNISSGTSYSTNSQGDLLDDKNPTVFEFVDQTDGQIKERYWNFQGLGRIIKKFYTIQQILNNDNSSTVFIERNLGFDLDQNDTVAIVYTEEQKVITKFKKILDISESGNQYKEITLDGQLNTDSGVIGKILPEETNSYTEKDPNTHTINFIYKSNIANSNYDPSLFVLFNNQVSRKVFLKEQITID